MAINIVTDSTSDLPEDLAKQMGITIVPARVNFGDEEFIDRVDITADEFYHRLVTGSVVPKTSQPTVGELIEAYERVGQESDGIVSVHPSSKLAGNYNNAVWAKEQANVSCPIEVIDSLQISMGIGLIVLTAAHATQEANDMDKVVTATESAVKRCQGFALLDTLEYLEKGGRIGKAKSLLGKIMRIKPLIINREGEAHVLGKARTFKGGLQRLQEVAREFAPIDELAVSYSTTPDDAHMVSENLRELLPEGKEPLIVRIGPVLGTYGGPGVIGISLLRSKA